jgi:hypothetical protein
VAGEGAVSFRQRPGLDHAVGTIVAAWLPGLLNVGLTTVGLRKSGKALEEDLEGQFEGQNGARVCLPEPVSACVG